MAVHKLWLCFEDSEVDHRKRTGGCIIAVKILRPGKAHIIDQIGVYSKLSEGCLSFNLRYSVDIDKNLDCLLALIRYQADRDVNLRSKVTTVDRLYNMIENLTYPKVNRLRVPGQAAAWTCRE